ncbi:MAG TPA: hypothetical protein VEF33_10945 [Syntrophales bacterium]|nr:hypothetical protein [Syntrophales bacterium]
MTIIDEEIRQVIRDKKLQNWFNQYPWLTGYLENPKSSIWFIAENPSLRGLEKSPCQNKNEPQISNGIGIKAIFS